MRLYHIDGTLIGSESGLLLTDNSNEIRGLTSPISRGYALVTHDNIWRPNAEREPYTKGDLVSTLHLPLDEMKEFGKRDYVEVLHRWDVTESQVVLITNCFEDYNREYKKDLKAAGKPYTTMIKLMKAARKEALNDVPTPAQKVLWSLDSLLSE